MITVMLMAMTLVCAGCAGSSGVPATVVEGAGAPADTARWLRATWGEPDRGREYRLYVPAGGAAGRALFVVLHGCTQTADAFAAATRFNDHAAAGDFLVLYPEQPVTAHPLRCWNWYEPAHQQRGSGEPALLAELTRAIVAEYDVATDRVYIVGISAGALMAGILAAAYPEQFAGLALHSGSMYAPARTVADGMAVMRGELPSVEASAAAAHAAMGARARPLPVLIFHGAADAVVTVANGHAAARQWLLTAGLAAGEPAQEPVRHDGVANGYTYERLRWPVGGSAVELWVIEGLGHAWSGGLAGGSYADPRGPDATATIVDFLLRGGRP